MVTYDYFKFWVVSQEVILLNYQSYPFSSEGFFAIIGKSNIQLSFN